MEDSGEDVDLFGVFVGVLEEVEFYFGVEGGDLFCCELEGGLGLDGSGNF